MGKQEQGREKAGHSHEKNRKHPHRGCFHPPLLKSLAGSSRLPLPHHCVIHKANQNLREL